MVNITNNLLPTQALNLKPNTSIDSLFKLGQTLTANIESVNGNQVKLTIGNQSLLASTKQSIPESGTIQVKVNQVKPNVQLLILNPQNKPIPNKDSQKVTQAAYRQFIPSQAPLTQVFQQINQLQSLPLSLQSPIQQLLGQVIKTSQGLSAQAIKQKLADSGLFLESKLTNSDKSIQASIKNDVKAQLLQLQQQVKALQQQNTTPQLSKLSTLLNQALSRLTVQQIQLFENPNITPMEIPFERNHAINKDFIELRKNETHDHNFWEAYIDLTLPNGSLSTKLRLSQDGLLDCFVWCETEDLKREVESQIHRLHEYLSNADLKINSIQITPSKPVKNKQATKVALIDIKI